MISFFQAIAIVLDLGIYAMSMLMRPSTTQHVLIWCGSAGVLVLVCTAPFTWRKRHRAGREAARGARRCACAIESTELSAQEKADFADLAERFGAGTSGGEAP